MNYSIRFKDESDRTQRSEVIPFDSEDAAADYARAVLASITSSENEGGSSFVQR